MRKNGWVIASILMGLMACSGCDESSSDDADNNEDDCIIFGNIVCPIDQTRCSGNLVQKCSINLFGCFYWKDVQACEVCSDGACSGTSSQPCQDGSCSEIPPKNCTNACTQNDARCEGNVLQFCAVGEDGCTFWKDEKTCPNGCEIDHCVADNLPTECETQCNVGQSYCKGQNVVECQTDADGCPVEVEIEQCSGTCSNGECVACSNSCEIGSKKCLGKTLSECVDKDGCARYESVKKCESSCYPDVLKCSEDLPTCKIIDGRKGTILQWTDGDTLWVRAKTDGTCNDYEYTANSSGVYSWKNVRFDIRLHGIDAPECSKAQNQYYYYTCKQDSSYGNDNEPMGYEAWDAASKLLPYNTEITIYCEQTQNDGTCALDATKKRYLTYIGYEKNNASYDFSTELARMGYAFSNTKFTSSKRKVICDAQREAQQAKVGLWSLGDTPEDVFSQMGSDKRKWLSSMTSKCNSAK